MVKSADHENHNEEAGVSTGQAYLGLGAPGHDDGGGVFARGRPRALGDGKAQGRRRLEHGITAERQHPLLRPQLLRLEFNRADHL